MEQVRMAVAGLARAAAGHQSAGVYHREYFGVATDGFDCYQGCGFKRIQKFGHLLLVIDYPEFLGGV